MTKDQVDRTVQTVRALGQRADSEHDLLEAIAETVRRVVPYDGSVWMSTDTKATLFNDGFIDRMDAATCEPWFHNELHVADVHKFRELDGKQAVALSQLADRTISARWRMFRDLDRDDEARITMSDAAGAWASVALHRDVGQPDFAPDELRLLDDVAPAVIAGLRRLALLRTAAADAVPGGPGMLRVGADGTAVPLTSSGAAWLELLQPVRTDHNATSLVAIATLVRGGAAGGGPVSVRSRTRDGQMVTLHAERQLGDEALVVIVEPSRPDEVALLLSRAYGLSEREQEVTLAISRGRSTKEMADALFLSQHTIRDHVKAAMAKVGVSSRGELVAALFERHYAADLDPRVVT